MLEPKFVETAMSVKKDGWFYRFFRFSSSPRVLLVVAVLMIICQFISQMEMVVRGWFFQWPYFADQNRYISYALFYRASFADGGIGGLIEAYQARPPYSFTLLVSSLPLLAWAEQTVHVLHGQLGYFVVALDLAVFRLAWRTGRTFYAGFAALMVIHGTTSGIFNSPGFLIPADMFFYQLSFATTVTTVVGAALMVEILYAKKIGRWSILLCLFLIGAILLRPSAMPYFVAQLIPPSIVVAAWFFWQGQRRQALCLGGAVLVSVCVSTPHLLVISRNVLDYAQRAHRDYAIDSYSYYWERAQISSPVFLTAFHLLMLGAILELPPLAVLLFRDHRKLLLSRNLSRVAVVWGVSSWIYLSSYILPSLSPAKNKWIGEAFMLLTLTYGTARLFTLLNLVTTIKFRYPISREFARPAIASAIVAICSLLILADARGVHLTLDAWPSFKRDKVVAKKISHELEASLNHWASQHDYKHTLVYLYGNLQGTGGFNTHSLRAEPGRDRLQDIRIWTARNEWDVSDCVMAVIPIVDPTMREYYFVRGYTQEDMDNALAEVKELGFEHYESIEIVPGIALEVYARTDEQLSEKDFEPKNYYP